MDQSLNYQIIDLYQEIRFAARHSLEDESSFEHKRRQLRDQITNTGYIETKCGSRIDTLSTPGRLGGHEVWLMCPKCQSRRRKLLKTPAGFSCRSCSQIPYFLKNLPHSTNGEVLRAMHFATKADRIRNNSLRLGKKRYQKLVTYLDKTTGFNHLEKLIDDLNDQDAE